jgi:hypothetical protein
MDADAPACRAHRAVGRAWRGRTWLSGTLGCSRRRRKRRPQGLATCDRAILGFNRPQASAWSKTQERGAARQGDAEKQQAHFTRPSGARRKARGWRRCLAVLACATCDQLRRHPHVSDGYTVRKAPCHGRCLMVLLEKAARALSELSRCQVELVPTTGRVGRLHPQSGTSDLPVSLALSIQRSIATPINRRRVAAEHRAMGKRAPLVVQYRTPVTERDVSRVCQTPLPDTCSIV